MQEQELSDLIRMINLMVEVESAAGTFYKNCAEIFEDDSSFWLNLSKEESLHAEVLAKLSAMIKRKPQEFEPGKLFSTAELRDFISRINSHSENLMKGALTIKDVLLAAYRIESTLIDAGYTKIVRTENPKYLEALANLASASYKHREKINRRLKEHKTDGIAPR